jgi:hypothetical protein
MTHLIMAPWPMTHWPFIAASYALGVLVPLVFGIAAFTRMGSARRRLAAIDPRANRSGSAAARARATQDSAP